MLQQLLLSWSTVSRHAGYSSSRRIHGMWNLPRPGIEPVSAVLQGRFLKTRPPGKPKFPFNNGNFFGLMMPGNIWKQVGRTACQGRWYWVGKTEAALEMWGSETWLPGSRVNSVFLPGCGLRIPCCWIHDYSQDIMVLSDVWIWGSSIPGALWTLSVPSLRVSSPLRNC